LLRRRDDGAWLLGYEALERLGADSAIPAGWQPADARPVAAGQDAAATAGDAPRGLTAEDIAAIRQRFETLRSQHERRMSRAAAAIERSRETRSSLHRQRGPLARW
jgi:hypothetical protein